MLNEITWASSEEHNSSSSEARAWETSGLIDVSICDLRTAP